MRSVPGELLAGRHTPSSRFCQGSHRLCCCTAAVPKPCPARQHSEQSEVALPFFSLTCKFEASRTQTETALALLLSSIWTSSPNTQQHAVRRRHLSVRRLPWGKARSANTCSRHTQTAQGSGGTDKCTPSPAWLQLSAPLGFPDSPPAPR